MVESRCPQRFFFAASISRSTSAGVRCSRDRYSSFGRRLGEVAIVDSIALHCANKISFTNSWQGVSWFSARWAKKDRRTGGGKAVEFWRTQAEPGIIGPPSRAQFYKHVLCHRSKCRPSLRPPVSSPVY